MSNYVKVSMLLISVLCLPVLAQRANSRAGRGYREGASFVMKHLALQEGQVVVDIGAGDGWWANRMAQEVGATGVVHAGEVVQSKVDTITKKYANTPQIKAYRCPMDGSGQPDNTCDLVYISKTYHHLEGHVEYLRHLTQVTKPSGRLAIVELHTELASGRGKDHAWKPGLLTQQAEEAGWILQTYTMIPGSDHFIAVFIKPAFLKQQIEEALAKRKKN
jgi:ubiquinone/menaquinone biosynthesis C-methylase UbiE